MNILLIGGGGREHALAWKLAQSSDRGRLFVAPGNAGTEEIAENVSIDANDTDALIKFARQNKIGLTIIGPEGPLASGIVDALEDAGLVVFGPTKAAAHIETSKVFAKEIMHSQHVPTASNGTFSTANDALSYVRGHKFPLFIKADGLAFGKGAERADNPEQASTIIKDMMLGSRHGTASKRVLIEKFMPGREASLHAICDGTSYKMFPVSQDYKQVYDDDNGPNTGGIGSVVPVPAFTMDDAVSLGEKFVAPILAELKQRGTPFKGILYPGLKFTPEGPKIVEYNARFGDPESEVYMRLLESDLCQIMMACTQESLHKLDMTWRTQSAISVVLCSGGYPGEYKTGFPIEGIPDANALDGIVVFHAGTKNRAGKVMTAGGRVLNVTATGSSIQEAQTKAYEAVKLISFEGKHFRTDIGNNALATF